jgi:hypothetical protein
MKFKDEIRPFDANKQSLKYYQYEISKYGEQPTYDVADNRGWTDNKTMWFDDVFMSPDLRAPLRPWRMQDASARQQDSRASKQ